MANSQDNLSPFDLGARPQAAEIARDLTRLIHTESLRPGDQLPTQAALRESRGYHNNTLDAAMDILVRSGVVTRKRRVGTVVVDPHRPVPGLWRVGLTVIPAVSEQVYYAQSLQFMQTHLQAAGADISLFMQRSDLGRGPKRLADFDHLAEACDARRLDAVVTPIALEQEDWAGRHEQGLELTHIGAWENAPAGVVIDPGPMMTDAVERLLGMGCQRLAAVSIKGPKPGFHGFWDAFRAAAEAGGLPSGAAISLHGGDGPCGGWHVAEQILAMPTEQRPDGLIVLDDRIATGLTAILASRDGGYRPNIVVQTNQQAPLAYAMPVIHYDVDIDALVREGVDNLMARLQSPGAPLRRTHAYPVLHSPETHHLLIHRHQDAAPALAV